MAKHLNKRRNNNRMYNRYAKEQQQQQQQKRVYETYEKSIVEEFSVSGDC
jgi:hypothetical protein